jgi:gas vesicle protein
MTKFEDTVKEMESQVQELEKDLAAKVENLDDEGKQKAKALVEKTEQAIKSTIDKVKNVIADVQEDEKLDEFLDKVKAKSMEAVEFTKVKVSELTNNKEKDNTLEKLGNDIMNEFEKVKDSDALKRTADFLSDIQNKINEFFEKPEVKQAIEKAKTTTVNIAEKGVEGLKKALNTEPKEEKTFEQQVQEVHNDEPKE